MRRIKQDVTIAVVLAVIGSGVTGPSMAGERRYEAAGELELAMEENEMNGDAVARVRSLIAEARRLQLAGDEDGAAKAMATALDLLA